MDERRARELSPRMRGRLLVALLILGALTIAAGIGIGVTLHDRSETQDSLDHWRERLRASEAAPDPAARRLGFDSPKARIRRLEEHLESTSGTLTTTIVMFAFFGVMTVLGLRAWRRRNGEVGDIEKGDAR